MRYTFRLMMEDRRYLPPVQEWEILDIQHDTVVAKCYNEKDAKTVKDALNFVDATVNVLKELTKKI